MIMEARGNAARSETWMVIFRWRIGNVIQLHAQEKNWIASCGRAHRAGVHVSRPHPLIRPRLA
jgi:hypothetical protein